MTPYELRFEIFKQAYNMLHDEYCMKYEISNLEHQNSGKSEFPEFPTLDQVLKQSEIINNFVSERQ
jgi:hypothetical protein